MDSLQYDLPFSFERSFFSLLPFQDFLGCWWPSTRLPSLSAFSKWGASVEPLKHSHEKFVEAC